MARRAGRSIRAGPEFVGSGGTAFNTVISNGGLVELLSGSFNNGATISSGGTLLLVGIVTQSGGNSILSGGTIEVGSGYITRSGSPVNSGATNIVLSGGTGCSILINSGGIEIVSAGGIILNTTILAACLLCWVKPAE